MEESSNGGVNPFHYNSFLKMLFSFKISCWKGKLQLAIQPQVSMFIKTQMSNGFK